MQLLEHLKPVTVAYREFVIRRNEKLKYLFDCLTKNTQTLAKLWQYTREGDEFLVYDPLAIPVEGFDVALLANIEATRLEGVEELSLSIKDFDPNDIDENNVYTKAIDDPRKMRSTLDFEKALEWCDVYVCMEHIEERLRLALDKEKEIGILQELLDRINRAMELNKPIFLGNYFNTEYRKIAEEYPNCLNKFITTEDLEEIKQYKASYFSDGGSSTVKLTMVVGTSGMCGKMSNTMKLQKDFEKCGERVAVIVTEEIYHFLDSEKYLLYPFCRNFSLLTLDEESEYLRCLIEKIIEDVRPNRILITSQGGFGFPGTIHDYEHDEVKSKGVLSNLYLSTIGSYTAAICSSWKHLIDLEKLISFMRLQGVGIDGIFISPLNLDPSKELQVKEGLNFKVRPVVDGESLLSNLLGFVLNHPEYPYFCDYMGVQEKLEAALHDEKFVDVYKSYLAHNLVQRLKVVSENFLGITGNAMYCNAIGRELAEVDFDLDEKLKQEILELAEQYQI